MANEASFARSERFEGEIGRRRSDGGFKKAFVASLTFETQVDSKVGSSQTRSCDDPVCRSDAMKQRVPDQELFGPLVGVAALLLVIEQILAATRFRRFP